MLSLTPLSLGNLTERNTILCRILVQSRARRCGGRGSSCFFFSSVLSFLSLHRGESMGRRGLSLRGGAVGGYEELREQVLARLNPNILPSPLCRDTGLHPHSPGNTFPPSRLHPGTLNALSNMHQQYFIIGSFAAQCTPG